MCLEEKELEAHGWRVVTEIQGNLYSSDTALQDCLIHQKIYF
jgi:hypothetical protein